LIHQQQQAQQQVHTVSLRQQQHQQQQAVPLPLHHQQQQPAPPDGLQRSNSSITQLLMQPVRQLSIPACSCCCGGGGCRSALPSAQPDMTEACAVARFAGHLELEVMSTTTGGHNHGHFQVRGYEVQFNLHTHHDLGTYVWAAPVWLCIQRCGKQAGLPQNVPAGCRHGA
jgi:hypothetical protein